MPRSRSFFAASFALWSVACAAGCPPGQTTVDKICVTQDMANYIACMRDASIDSIDVDQSIALSNEVELLGQDAKSTADLNDLLKKKFNKKSEASTRRVLDDCMERSKRSAMAESSDVRTLGWWLGGAGLAASAVGGVFVYRAATKNDQASQYCSGNGCDEQGFQLRTQARTAGNLATAFMLPGVALLGTGVVLVLAGGPSSPGDEARRVALALGASASGLSLSGQW
jgi:hypothetical protein